MKRNLRMKKPIIKCILLVLLLIAAPGAKSGFAKAAPSISSNYYCLIDGETAQVLWGKNQDEKRPVASTTKIMTALLAVEYADLDEIAVVSRNAQLTPEYAIDLREGQTLTIGELIKIALLRSANDAAVVLAEHITGDERLFAHLMSKKACILGAYNTHFENSSGLPSASGYSSAYDMALISRLALRDVYIAQMVSTAKDSFQHPSYRQPLTITNTNSLLTTFPGADGIKTGTTNAAGRCLAASATRDQRQLIAVCLRSGQRFGDCARLLEYGFTSFEPALVLDQHQPFKTVKLPEYQLHIDLFPDRNLNLWYDGEQPDIIREVVMDYAFELPVQKGEPLGRVLIYAGGRHIDSVNLVSGQTAKNTAVNQWLKRWFKGKNEALAE